MEKRLTAPVETTGGSIRGYYEDDEVMVFKGIPYAEAPMGENRFRPAIPYAHRDGVRDCLEFGPSCWQNSLDEVSALIWTEEFIIRNKNFTEDCLTLNVWTAEGKKGMPVVLYLYGGGFNSGGSSCDIYNGTPFVKGGVVYVTFTHREHVFGWLASKELTEESDHGMSGNYALSDIEVALNWIRDNIASFGGDPDQVTVWGQSSGGSQANLLAVSERMRPLYARTVSMGLNSFPSRNLLRWLTPEDAYALSEDFVNEFGRTPEKLREIPPEEILKHTGIKGPVIDGYYMKDTFRNEIKAGVNPDVTMMMGVDGEDHIIAPMFFLLRGAAQNEDRDEFVKWLTAFYPDTADEIMEEYKADSEGLLQAATNIAKDAMVHDLLEFAFHRSRNSSAKTYIYHFTHVMPGPNADKFGSFHSCEVPYFTNFLSPLRADYWKDEDRELAEKMNRLIIGYIKDGEPDIPDFVPSDGTNIFMISAKEQKNVVIPKEQLDKWYRLFSVDN